LATDATAVTAIPELAVWVTVSGTTDDNVAGVDFSGVALSVFVRGLNAASERDGDIDIDATERWLTFPAAKDDNDKVRWLDSDADDLERSHRRVRWCLVSVWEREKGCVDQLSVTDNVFLLRWPVFVVVNVDVGLVGVTSVGVPDCVWDHVVVTVEEGAVVALTVRVRFFGVTAIVGSGEGAGGGGMKPTLDVHEGATSKGKGGTGGYPTRGRVDHTTAE
jgi:hypothetical protein